MATVWMDHMPAGFPEDDASDGVDDKWTYYKLRVPKGYCQGVQHVGEVASKQFDAAYGMHNSHLDMETDYATGYAKRIPRGRKVVMFDTKKYLMDLLVCHVRITERLIIVVWKGNMANGLTYKVTGWLRGTKKPHQNVMHSMYVLRPDRSATSWRHRGTAPGDSSCRFRAARRKRAVSI
jgi:hypothetical protein